jgi:hypothetical protein
MIIYTLEAVAILLDEKPELESIKKNMLSDANFLGRLKNLKP